MLCHNTCYLPVGFTSPLALMLFLILLFFFHSASCLPFPPSFHCLSTERMRNKTYQLQPSNVQWYQIKRCSSLVGLTVLYMLQRNFYHTALYIHHHKWLGVAQEEKRKVWQSTLLSRTLANIKTFSPISPSDYSLPCFLRVQKLPVGSLSRILCCTYCSKLRKHHTMLLEPSWKKYNYDHRWVLLYS